MLEHGRQQGAAGPALAEGLERRQALDGIFYLLRTGCQWKALPREFGAASTVHDRCQLWRQAGVFQRLWQEGLLEYAALKGIEWEWQALDGAITKAPLGGSSHRP
jgi:putative transposase